MKYTKPYTLRYRLLLWLLPPVLLLTVVWTIGVYAVVLHFANVAYDRALEDSAQSFAGQVHINGDNIVVDLPEEARNIIKYDRVDDIYFSVTNAKGGTVFGNNAASLCEVPKRLPGSTNYCNGKIDGNKIRIAEYTLPASTEAKPVVVRVAETVNKRNQLANEVLRFTLLPQAIFIIGVAILIWLGVGKGMLPVRLIRDAIARRTHEDLSPLEDKEMPAELHEQVRVINDLMSRLEKTINAQQRFIADATHQIRTPIAVIRAQSELALRLDNPDELKQEVAKIQHSSARLVRLSNQLLNLNRAEAGRLHALYSEKIAVAELLEDVVADMVPFALQKDIEISLHNEVEGTHIHGDRIFLREMLVNLIDNAIRYSPAESWIRVIAKTNVEQVVLSVVDCGPGIPAHELEKVLERFYRCAHVPSDGSGLGLAIAREIALLHHGSIKLSQAPGGVGLQADIYLPIALAT